MERHDELDQPVSLGLVDEETRGASRFPFPDTLGEYDALGLSDE